VHSATSRSTSKELRKPGRDRNREFTRLSEEVQARTRELSRSLNDLRTAQDRLIQTEKLA
jgi:hypothetical protein